MKLLMRSILVGVLALATTTQAALALGSSERDRYGREDRRDRDRNDYDRDRDRDRDRGGRGSHLCIASHDAYDGRVDYTVTAHVSSESECIQHCYNTIVPSDIHGWEYEYWNMCWYDDGYRKGFIFP